jgi:hypothetical protein
MRMWSGPTSARTWATAGIAMRTANELSSIDFRKRLFI